MRNLYCPTCRRRTAHRDNGDRWECAEHEPEHTCHGAIFCGFPRPIAERECPACNPAATIPGSL